MEPGHTPVSHESGCINVLGLDVAFRPGADMARVRETAKFLQDRYDALKTPGVQGKDVLLTFLALGLADELLQMKIRQTELETRLEALLEKIDLVNDFSLGRP